MPLSSGDRSIINDLFGLDHSVIQHIYSKRVTDLLNMVIFILLDLSLQRCLSFLFNLCLYII